MLLEQASVWYTARRFRLVKTRSGCIDRTLEADGQSAGGETHRTRFRPSKCVFRLMAHSWSWRAALVTNDERSRVVHSSQGFHREFDVRNDLWLRRCALRGSRPGVETVDHRNSAGRFPRSSERPRLDLFRRWRSKAAMAVTTSRLPDKRDACVRPSCLATPQLLLTGYSLDTGRRILSIAGKPHQPVHRFRRRRAPERHLRLAIEPRPGRPILLRDALRCVPERSFSPRDRFGHTIQPALRRHQPAAAAVQPAGASPPFVVSPPGLNLQAPRTNLLRRRTPSPLTFNDRR